MGDYTGPPMSAFANSGSFGIQLLEWEQARPRAMLIRELVFVHEQGVPMEIELDEFDSLSEHAIAISRAGEVVGTGRLLPDGHIGRMAVLKAWRGKGVGALLLAALVRRAIERGFGAVMLNAQIHAKAFYEKAGFTVQGEPFMEAGIPHVSMRRVLGT